ncbi:MAG TPA: F0F1 ATP synthase subunit A [Acetobacteraceae bacterium]|nr:F0F1 ATP synthase subunit A [Acetobacteraceae bacterium]
MGSPLSLHIAFYIGPVAVSTPVLVTWVIMLLLSGGAWLLTRRLSIHSSSRQAALEVVVGAIEVQIRDTMRTDPAPYLPLIGTLFLFTFTANWSSLLPGAEPPTAHIETDAALALIVFFAVGYYGIKSRGLRGYVATFAEPSILMIPLNLIETITRTFSLVVRLFGNVMSGVFVVGIVLSLVGLLVPVPLMALDLLTGAVQAYIFSVLAMVFIAGVLGPDSETKQQEGK